MANSALRRPCIKVASALASPVVPALSGTLQRRVLPGLPPPPPAMMAAEGVRRKDARARRRAADDEDEGESGPAGACGGLRLGKDVNGRPPFTRRKLCCRLGAAAASASAPLGWAAAPIGFRKETRPEARFGNGRGGGSTVAGTWTQDVVAAAAPAPCQWRWAQNVRRKASAASSAANTTTAATVPAAAGARRPAAAPSPWAGS